MNHNSVVEIRTYLEIHRIAPKKRWGQNFLVDGNARSRIIDLCSVAGGTRAWEIGPGLGALTDALIDSGAKMTLFEIDHGLVRLLRERYGDAVRIVVGDAVSTVASELTGVSTVPDIILGNLPYRSAGAIVASIAEAEPVVPRMVFMVQRELADRFTAAPGQADYSALTVLIRSRYDVQRVLAVKGGAFYPAPRVGSAVVVFEPAPGNSGPATQQRTSRIARLVFSERRKKIATVLRRKAAAGDVTAKRALDGAGTAGIDVSLRPGEIPVNEYLRWGETVQADD